VRRAFELAQNELTVAGSEPALLTAVRIRPISAREAAEEAVEMMTFAGSFVTAITQWDGVAIGDGQVGPVTRAINQLILRDMTEESSPLLEPLPVL